MRIVWLQRLQRRAVIMRITSQRGEYVLVIAGKDRNELKEEAQAQWLTMSEQEHVDMYIAQGLDKKRL